MNDEKKALRRLDALATLDLLAQIADTEKGSEQHRALLRRLAEQGMTLKAKQFFGIDPMSVTCRRIDPRDPYSPEDDERLGVHPAFTSDEEATAWLRGNLPLLVMTVTLGSAVAAILQDALDGERVHVKQARAALEAYMNCNTALIGATDITGYPTPEREDIEARLMAKVASRAGVGDAVDTIYEQMQRMREEGVLDMSPPPPNTKLN
jgi:hypothetical protein